MEYILGSWDWYVAGPLIGLFVPLLLLVGNKLFGLSSSFQHICATLLPSGKRGFINYDFKKQSWKFYFVIGIFIGGFISANFLSNEPVSFLPDHYYNWSGYLQLLIGGVLIGFGTRYGDGCTSGHAITGLSLLNLASLKATIAFFTGGVVYTSLVVYVF